MVREFIVAALVLLILILFILFIINSLCLEVANKIKRDSEKLFDSYTKTLDKMYVKKVEEKPSVEVVKQEEKKVYVLPNVLQEQSYKDTTVFDINEAINSKFDVNYEEMINQIDTSESREYLVHKKMNDLLKENNRVYMISCLSSNEQLEVMKEIIKEDSDFNIYVDKLNDNFNIITFKEYIEERLANTDCKLTIFTSNKNDLTKSTDDIKYVYDSRMIVGVQCLQKDKLYDIGIEREEVC